MEHSDSTPEEYIAERRINKVGQIVPKHLGHVLIHDIAIHLLVADHDCPGKVCALAFVERPHDLGQFLFLVFSVTLYIKLADCVVETSSYIVTTAYEKRQEKLERDKIVLSEKLENVEPFRGRLEECMEISLRILSTLWSIYEKNPVLDSKQCSD